MAITLDLNWNSTYKIVIICCGFICGGLGNNIVFSNISRPQVNRHLQFE